MKVIDRSLMPFVTAALLTIGLTACSSADDGTRATVTASGGSAAETKTTTQFKTTTVTKPAVTTTVTKPAVTKTVTSTVQLTPTSTSKTSSPAPSGLEVGGPGITASDSDGAADIVVLSVRREAEGGDSYADPPKNGTYLVVDVSYTCTEGKFTYNPFDWAARDSEGRAHEPEYSSGFDDARLDSGVLASGSIARGVVIFDVPDGSLTLEYTLGFEAPAIWDIPA